MSKLNASPLGITLDSRIGDPGPDYESTAMVASKFNRPGNKTIQFSPWPSGALDDKKSLPTDRRKIHSDDIYDSRLNNILRILDSTFVTEKGNTFNPLKLTAMDFAYLKNVGVYPNNRLMIARRFGSPVADDPYTIAQNSISTLISWVPEGENFISFELGEEWDSAEADFTKIFNELGEDISKAVLGKLGSYAAGGAGAVPLPGFTEIFQRKIMKELGIIKSDTEDFIPASHPNLIKEAKKRKTIGYSEPGSTLKATISIKMVCEWEQKFIAGVDPTIAWMDIMNTVLRFSSSESQFYLGGNSDAAKGFRGFIKKLTSRPLEAIDEIVSKITSAMVEIVDKIKKALNGDDSDEERDDEQMATDFLNAFKEIEATAIKGLALKYKERLIGVTNALTGAPSTPWHITIGNPLRPVFCSGDMLVESVTVTLGPELAFNDLPSSIKAEFTLKNARNLGIQEILAKFNVGYLRTIKVKPDLYVAKVDADFITPDVDRVGTQSVPTTSFGDKTVTNPNFPGQSNISSSDAFENPGTGVSGTGNSGETRVGNTLLNTGNINPDANSTEIVSSELNNSFNPNITPG